MLGAATAVLMAGPTFAQEEAAATTPAEPVAEAPAEAAPAVAPAEAAPEVVAAPAVETPAPAAPAPVEPAKPEEGTLDEAKAMAIKAAALVKDMGKDKALEIFNKAESEFIDRDLYVFAVDNDGVFIAHPKKPALVGQNMMDMKDVDGVELVRKFVEVQTEGWVDYKWPHPIKKEQMPKSSYIVRAGDMVVGVGAYKTQ